MGRIMCTRTLLKALEHRGRRGFETDRPLVSGTLLGNWAATVARLKRRTLVLALNERTYLTLVFPLVPRHAFRSNFATALTEALEDHHVPRDTAVRESAELEVSHLVPLRDPTLATALDNVEFICDVELDYTDDLRDVQTSLNEFPHPNREPCAATEAVVLLFAAAAASHARRVRPLPD